MEQGKKYQRRGGALLQSLDGPLAQKAFFVCQGKRHWADSEWVGEHFGSFANSVLHVPSVVLESFKPGQPTSRDWSRLRNEPGNIRTVRDAREAVATLASGHGVEIGAGSSPFPIPLNCRVTYADVYSYEQLLENAYPGQILCDIVEPDIVTEFTSLDKIPDESLDFFVACHVIEHSSNPIRSIELALTKIRRGGQLILVVPEKTRTFDRARPLTDLKHLIADYQEPSLTRDEENYREFFALAAGFYDPSHGDFDAFWRKHMRENYSIHFHTWSLNSFRDMLQWYQENVSPFGYLWTHDVVDDGIEFYVNISK